MPYRVGLIVPSTNVTVETELPRILRAADVDVTFHSSRMRMHAVTPEGLVAMNAQRERCVLEVGGRRRRRRALRLSGGDHGLRAGASTTESRPPSRAARGGRIRRGDAVQCGRPDHRAVRPTASAGFALVMPYLRPLAETVVTYLTDAGFEVADWRALEVQDNAEVGCIDPARVMAAARSLDLTGVDALVLSCCVQMPSLGLIQAAEDEFGLPVLSAATAGAYTLLRRLGHPVDVVGMGSLLRADALATAR